MEISKLAFRALWVMGLFAAAAIALGNGSAVVAWTNASESTGTFSTGGDQPHGTLSQDVPTAPGFSETFSAASATTTTPGGTGTTGASASANATAKVSTVSYDQSIKAEQAAAKVEEIIKNDTKLQQAIKDAFGLTELGADKIKDIAQATAEAAKSITSARSISTDSSGKTTTLSLSFAYSGEGDARNFVVYDAVPKSFAESSDNITVIAGGATVGIIEKDPKYSFTYPTISKGDSKTISYSVNRKLDSSVVNSFPAPVFIAEKIVNVTRAPAQPPSGAPPTGKPIQAPTSGFSAIIAAIIVALLIIGWILLQRSKAKAINKYGFSANNPGAKKRTRALHGEI